MENYWDNLERPIIIAGPCSVESKEQIIEIAKAVKKAGATMLRGGAFKPRTSPKSWQGLGEEGLKYLVMAREETGLPIVTEIMTETQIPLFEEYEIDACQIGARNCQNYPLLKELGKTTRPVLLKRGMGQRIEELLHSAAYITTGGNPNVAVCERGIRTFETLTRFTFDINAIPLIKKISNLPVIADPSHGTGRADIVASVARAAIAAGADGLIIEVHTDPERSKVDRDQAIDPNSLERIASDVKAIRSVVGDDE